MQDKYHPLLLVQNNNGVVFFFCCSAHNAIYLLYFYESTYTELNVTIKKLSLKRLRFHVVVYCLYHGLTLRSMDSETQIQYVRVLCNSMQ